MVIAVMSVLLVAGGDNIVWGTFKALVQLLNIGWGT